MNNNIKLSHSIQKNSNSEQVSLFPQTRKSKTPNERILKLKKHNHPHGRNERIRILRARLKNYPNEIRMLYAYLEKTIPEKEKKYQNVIFDPLVEDQVIKMIR